jgi:NAD(P)-dependent dehydrogenase (short-subunit alcohol dehydrogenase family)
MREDVRKFTDKVAVITGAASGIGRAMACRCAAERMKVVLVDVEGTALTQVERDILEAGGTVLAIRADVSKLSDVESLAQRTLREFGAVHLLFNNAGVFVTTPICESSIEDWQWIIGVNLWGVIYGTHVFLPLMREQGEESRIINTASGSGLVSSPLLGLYKVTKHAVVTFSETLYLEMMRRKANVGVSVLCPMWVNTRLADSERNRPIRLHNSLAEGAVEECSDEAMATETVCREGMKGGITAIQVADCVFEGIKQRKFYIFTQPEELKRMVRLRMQAILLERNPTDPKVRSSYRGRIGQRSCSSNLSRVSE